MVGAPVAAANIPALAAELPAGLRHLELSLDLGDELRSNANLTAALLPLAVARRGTLRTMRVEGLTPACPTAKALLPFGVHLV